MTATVTRLHPRQGQSQASETSHPFERYVLEQQPFYAGLESRVVRGDGVVAKVYNFGDIREWRELDTAQEGAGREIAFLTRAAEHGRTDVPRILEYGTMPGSRFNEPYAVMQAIDGPHPSGKNELTGI